MKTIDRPKDKESEQSDNMGRSNKKTGSSEQPAPIHQMTLRIPLDTFKRIEKAAAQLGIEPTGLVRMIVKENLAVYEHRAQQIK